MSNYTPRRGKKIGQENILEITAGNFPNSVKHICKFTYKSSACLKQDNFEGKHVSIHHSPTAENQKERKSSKKSGKTAQYI